MAQKYNVQNLKPVSERTSKELREMTKKGGIRSGEVRREKATFRATVQRMMELPLKKGDLKDMSAMEDANDANMTAKQMVVVAQIVKALNGDTKAAEFLSLYMPEDSGQSTEVNDAMMKSLGWNSAKVWGKKPKRKKKK